IFTGQPYLVCIDGYQNPAEVFKMRIDKLTTKFQEALADAQSLAVGNDNQYIEPIHLLAALIAQQDGSARSLLSQAGVQVQALQTALKDAMTRLPQVQGTD